MFHRVGLHSGRSAWYVTWTSGRGYKIPSTSMHRFLQMISILPFITGHLFEKPPFGMAFSRGTTVVTFYLNLLPDTGFTGHHAQFISLFGKLLWSNLCDTCLIYCRQRRNICDMLAYCRLFIPRTHGATSVCFVNQEEYRPCYNWNAFNDTFFILQSKYAPFTHGCQNVRKGLLSGNIILIYDHATAENMVICITWELVSPCYIIDESNLYLRRKFDTI